MNKSLKLKSIYELLNNEEGKPESFFIPSYQRGYRWTTQQVEELLEDIFEFDKDVQLERNKGFYCLQPIVVKKSKSPNYMWDVIDGQQRLTTIYIILKTAEEILRGYDLQIYNIGYETRESSSEFLETKLSKIDMTNIDFFHMSKTYEAIIKWFAKRNSKMTIIDRLKIKPIFDNGIDKAKNIRVIWYEIENEENDSLGNNKYQKDIEIFTRINMGKIPLTNAELIKALLIQGYSVNKNKEIKKNKQFELASEWDFIEYSLQNDDFWYFINKNKNEKATRIEFIFELIAEKYLKECNNNFPDLYEKELEKLNKSIDKYYEFHIINHYLHNDKRGDSEKEKENIYEKLWGEVKNYFRILNEWFEDREFFHKIGFLTIYSKKTMIEFIDKYIGTEESLTKKDFMKYLDKEIMELFKNLDIEKLTYNDGKSVRKVLLMFNIQTILKNKESNMRFQFDRYKKQDWDIEHIRSQTDKKYPKKETEKKDWIKDLENIVPIKKTVNELLNMSEKDFNQFFDTIQKSIEDVEGESDFDKDDIGNLALLDARTNRSYGNAFFPIKRKTIIENDMNGTFIPICTKNLFLKYYTQNATNLQKWIKDDAVDYKNKIIKTFDELKKGIENEQK